MSLSSLRKLTEEGVSFKSHIDGSAHMLTPERSIEIQCLLGSDIQMQLDECPAIPIEHEAAKESMELSVRWAKRSKAAFADFSTPGQALFGIVQGANYEDLRRQSLDGLMEIDFPGYSVGGLAVGEGREEMFRVLEFTTPHMDMAKPRYLMGVGKPGDIVGAVARGIDMFDCVAPTRSGRHGQAWTPTARLISRTHDSLKTTCRSIQTVTARQAGIIPRLICTICSEPVNIWDLCCLPGITFNIIKILWQGCGLQFVLVPWGHLLKNSARPLAKRSCDRAFIML